MAIPAQTPGLRCLTSGGQTLLLGNKIGSGGEGDIYAVQGQPGWAAKVYSAKNRTLEREQKLAYMAQHPPEPFGKQVSFAWPFELLYDPHQRFIGFVMPKLALERTALLFQVYHPGEAKKRGLSWRFRMAVAHNLAVLLEELHARGYVVGDLNESNFLVGNNGLVTLVDCDSVQVRTDQGKLYRCRVQKPEYTPPELQGISYSDVRLEPRHDNFALAVLIFYLLMQGRHPFAGKGIQTPEEGIRGGRSVLTGLEAMVGTPDPGILPQSLQRLFLLAFTRTSRPTAGQWKQALEAQYQALKQCSTLPAHWHSPHLRECPWCNPQAAKGQFKPLRPGERVLGYSTRRARALGQALLPTLPLSLALGILLGIFRQLLSLSFNPQHPITFTSLPLGANSSIQTVLGAYHLSNFPFYLAFLSLALGLLLPLGRTLGLALGLSVIVPFGLLPQLLHWLAAIYPAGLPQALHIPLLVLHMPLLVLGQVTLALLALPGIFLLLGIELLTSPLQAWGLPAPLAWGTLGLLAGLMVRSYRRLR